MKNDIRQFLIGLVIIMAALVVVGITGESERASLIHVNDMQEHHVRVAVVAGHGDVIERKYQTFGKQSPHWPDGSKMYEGRSTHDLAMRLVLELRKHQIDAELINPELEDISLKQRVFRVNTIWLRDPRTVGLFLHHNAQASHADNPGDYCDDDSLPGWMSPDTGGASGIEVFTYHGHSRSDDLAEIIIQEIEAEFLDVMPMRVDHTDGDQDKEAGFYVLRKTYGPAVLVEFGFMTTKTDSDIIQNPVYRQRYIKAITRAILKYDEL